MSNQSGVQQALRDYTGKSLDYNGDWHALFDADGIAAGSFNERLLAWINQTLSASYTNLPGAMQAYAVNQGFNNWSSINTLSLGGAVSVPSTALNWGGSGSELKWGFSTYLTWG